MIHEEMPRAETQRKQRKQRKQSLNQFFPRSLRLCARLHSPERADTLPIYPLTLLPKRIVDLHAIHILAVVQIFR